MTIKQHGGVFGRNPKFNDVEVESLSIAGNAVPDASTILVDGDIGSTVQGYDADTAKLDVAQTFTAEQTFNQNLIFAAGKGLNFAAAGSDGEFVDSEIFDDYEHGRFAPIYENTGTNPTFGAGGLNRGAYAKLGDLVVFTIRINQRIDTEGTGNIIITGLPFTASIRSGYVDNYACSISNYAQWDTRPDIASILAGGTTIALYTFGTATGSVALPATAYKIGSSAYNDIDITGCYFTDE